MDHLLFHCPFLTQSRELVKGWLRLMGCQAFNRQTIIEMTGIQSDIENYAISTYKYVIWKNRNIATLHTPVRRGVGGGGGINPLLLIIYKIIHIRM